MSKDSSGKTRNKRKKSKKKPVLIILCIVFLFIVSIIGGGLFYTYNLLGKMDKVDINEDNLGIDNNIDNKLSQYNGIQNILLFGVDAPEGGVGRSDSIMILTVDSKRNKIKVSSLIRDSYVSIKGHGEDKLNHAYAFGGPELAINTINTNFDLNIKDFASVNFTNLPKIIDQLGGIDLDITKEELKYINNYISNLNTVNKTNVGNITSPGVQHVNGTQALAYSRIRYTAGGDFERTHRHRIVLTALFDKFKKTSPSEYPTLLNELLPLVKTNLSSNEILGLATSVVKMGNTTMEQERFPTDKYSEGKMIKGIYYLTFNKEATVKQIHDYIFEDIKS